MDVFYSGKKPKSKHSLTRAIAHKVVIFCLGLIIGVVTKLFDIYTTNLGNIFSQISVWVFLCTIIAVYSSTAIRAAIHVFLFCSGMLLTYYVTAELTASVYSLKFVYGWTIFDVFSLFMGFCVWHAKGKGWISAIISIGVILITVIATIILFDKLRISDIILISLTGFILLKK